MAVLVFYTGARRLLEPVEIQSGFMIAAAAGGLVTELISLRLLFSGQKDNLNLKGAFWHVMQTFVGSLIIVLAATVIFFTGFVAIDPILGIAFGLVLVWASWVITRDALRILMETVPAEVDIELVSRALEEIGGVIEIHHVHAWALGSGKNLFSAHVHIEGDASHDRVLVEARDLLRSRFGFFFSTLQVETDCVGPGEASAIDFADRRPRALPE